MTDRRQQDPESFSLENLVGQSSSPPPPGSTAPRSDRPEGANGKSAAAGSVSGSGRLPGAEEEPFAAAGSEPISAWESPSRSTMRPPPLPSYAVPVAIFAGFAIMSVSVFAALMIAQGRQGEQPRPEGSLVKPVAPVMPVARNETVRTTTTPISPPLEAASALSSDPIAKQPPSPRNEKEATETADSLAASPLSASRSNRSSNGEIAPVSGALPVADGKVRPAPEEVSAKNKRRSTGDRAADPKTAEAASGADLTEQPTREQTLQALLKVEETARRCAEGQTGTAMITVKVAGAGGTVQGVSVDGVEGSIGLCIAREVYRARFPSFAKPVFTVRYPIKL